MQKCFDKLRLNNKPKILMSLRFQLAG